MNHVANTNRLLIVNDEKDFSELFQNVSANLGFSARTAGNYDAFCKIEKDFNPTVVILDLQMPGQDGIEYLKVLAKRKSAAKVIVASGSNNRTCSTALQLGGVLGLDMSAVLQKPVAIHALRHELRKAMYESQSVTAVRLSAAIKSGRIRPHYQAKVNRDQDGDWTITGVEALARWHQADGTVVMPDHFIGLAEESGLLKALTDSMLDQVAEQLGRWNKKGIRLRAAVNLPAALLADERLPDRLERIMLKHSVDNRQLVLEVPEDIVIECTASTVDVLDRLHDRNFGLVIDEFGTGYSSLEKLYRMPFDEIKIDRTLVRRAISSKDTRIVIEAIVLLGHKLGMSVGAEGVETQDVFDFLANSGCDTQQGFLIGRPVPAGEITSRLYQSDDASPPARAIVLGVGHSAPLATK